MGTISSSTVDIRGGKIQIDITHSSFANASFTLSSVGELEIDYDLEDDTDKSESVKLLIGDYKFSGWNELSTGTSFYSEIEGMSFSDEGNFVVTYTEPSGTTREFKFFFTKRDAELNRKRREFSLSGTPKLSSDDTISDYFGDSLTNNPTTATWVPDSGTNKVCVPAFRFIEDTIVEFNPNASNTVVSSATFEDVTVANLVGSEYYWVVVADGDAGGISIDEAISGLAASEGAIYGSAFGTNFYIQRTDTTNDVTISEADTQDINIISDYQIYNTISIAFYTDNDSEDFTTGASMGNAVIDQFHAKGSTLISVDDGSGGNSTATLSQGDIVIIDGTNYVVKSWNETADEITLVTGLDEPVLDNTDIHAASITLSDYNTFVSDADKNLFGVFDMESLCWGRWNDSNSEMNESTLSMDKDFTPNAVTSYGKAYGADGSRRIEIDVFGVNTIIPHQSFTLDSSFDSDYQGTYRPSSLTYVFEDDIIQIEAYQIA